MNINVERQPQCTATLRVEIPAEKVNGERNKIIQGFAGQARIKGFRPGKAPRELIEKRFAVEIAEELESRLVREALDEALRKEDLKVLDVEPPQSPTIHPDGAYSFTAKLMLAPEFDLPEYKGIEVEIPRIDVTPEMVDQNLDSLRERFGEFEDVEGRAAADGDFAVINYTSTIDGQSVEEALGKPIEFLAGRDDYWVKLDDESFLPGFAKQLTGMEADQEKAVTLNLPDDFPVEDARGREITFQVKLTGLKEQNLPELNDELAAKIIPDATLDSLKETIEGRIREDLERRVADLKVDRIVQVLNSQVEFELPEAILTSEIQGQADQMVERGISSGMSQEEIEAQQGDIFNAAGQQARVNLRTNFILQEIARTEELEIPDQELLQHLAMMAQRQQQPVKKFVKTLQKEGRLPGIRNSLLVGKAIDFVVEHANVTAVDPPPADEAPAEPAPDAAEEPTTTTESDE